MNKDYLLTYSMYRRAKYTLIGQWWPSPTPIWKRTPFPVGDMAQWLGGRRSNLPCPAPLWLTVDHFVVKLLAMGQPPRPTQPPIPPGSVNEEWSMYLHGLRRWRPLNYKTTCGCMGQSPWPRTLAAAWAVRQLCDGGTCGNRGAIQMNLIFTIYPFACAPAEHVSKYALLFMVRRLRFSLHSKSSGWSMVDIDADNSTANCKCDDFICLEIHAHMTNVSIQPLM